MDTRTSETRLRIDRLRDAIDETWVHCLVPRRDGRRLDWESGVVPAGASLAERAWKACKRDYWVEETLLGWHADDRLQSALADPALYRDGGSDAADRTARLKAAEEALAGAYERWMELEG